MRIAAALEAPIHITICFGDWYKTAIQISHIRTSSMLNMSK